MEDMQSHCRNVPEKETTDGQIIRRKYGYEYVRLCTISVRLCNGWIGLVFDYENEG